MVQPYETTLTGQQRVEAGLALLARAARDAGRGVQLVASGVLLLAKDRLRIATKPEALRRAFAALGAGVRTLLAMIVRAAAFGARAMVAAAPMMALWLAGAAVLGALSLWSLPEWSMPEWRMPEIDWRELFQLLIASLPAIATLVLLTGAFAVGGFLLSTLIEWVIKRLAREHALVVALVLVAAVAGAFIAASIGEATMFAFVAWFAFFAIFAGGAFFAIFSFGPSVASLFSLGRRSEGSRKIIAVLPEPVGANEKARLPTSKTLPPRAWLGFARLLAFVLALALLGALSTIWLRSPSGQHLIQSIVRTERAAPKTTSPSPASTTQSAVLLPLADGESGEVYWRNGYRNVTLRLDDNRAVQDIALPASACEAGAIVVFGAASADGAEEINVRLAQRRALWAGAWAQSQLSTCSTAPPVFSVSLGQAVGAPAAQQRRFRMLGLPPSDAASTPTQIQEIAKSAFAGLAQFTRFDVCAIAPEGAAQSPLVDPCRAP